MQETVLLTAVIPTYNRKESLLRTLAALARQTLPPNEFEVVVVSDGSPDSTVEAARALELPYRLRVLEQPNCGPSVARNYGARAACGDLLVFIDDDIEPVPDFLKIHAEAHSVHDNLVLIGPQSMPPGETCSVWIYWEHRMLERQYTRFISGEWNVGGNNLYSGNFSLSRRHLLDVGGFDPKFKRQEDVELGLRLEARGLEFRFDPAANGLHRPVRSFEAWYTTPYTYGVRDVQMARDKGTQVAMDMAKRHYRERNRATRILARIFIGKKVLEPLLFSLLKPAIPLANRMGVRSAALALCSVTFNLRYLQGMAKEIGGSSRMWQAIG